MLPVNQTIDSDSFRSSATRIAAIQSASSVSAVIVTPSSSNAALVTDLEFGNQYSSNQTIEFQPANVWDASANIRFKELAREEALRDLTAAEIFELEELTRLRRIAKYPRSAEEILWQRRQQKITDTLLDALKDYVDFHQGANHP